MKKILYLLLINCMLFSCKTAINKKYTSDYRVIKIDSVKNINIIYVEKIDATIKNSQILKIVSSKIKCNEKKQISVDKVYKLSIESLYPKNIVSHNLKGISYDGQVIPFDNDYNVVKDLFISTNLKGLCYKY